MTIHRVELPATGIEELRAEAFTEGFDFIERLIKEWSSGENRFDRQGEILCGYLDHGRVVAVGGLNRDPFSAPGHSSYQEGLREAWLATSRRRKESCHCSHRARPAEFSLCASSRRQSQRRAALREHWLLTVPRCNGDAHSDANRRTLAAPKTEPAT